MSDAANVKRQLTIKTGVVKRLTKEEKTYVKEAEEQEKRIEQYIADGKDEWHVKKQREVLQDCLQMIPDCQKRLASAVQDLEALLGSLSDDAELAGSKEAETAKEILQAAKEATSSSAPAASS